MSLVINEAVCATTGLPVSSGKCKCGCMRMPAALNRAKSAKTVNTRFDVLDLESERERSGLIVNSRHVETPGPIINRPFLPLPPSMSSLTANEQADVLDLENAPHRR